MADIPEGFCPCCGCEVETFSSARSLPHLQRYHVKMKVCFDNWQERHAVSGDPVEFQPTNVLELRKWAQVMAGYETRHTIVLKSRNPRDIAEARLAATVGVRTAGEYPIIEAHGQVIIVRASKSIALNKLSEKAFSKLDRATSEVIWNAIGIDPEELLMGSPEGRRLAPVGRGV